MPKRSLPSKPPIHPSKGNSWLGFWAGASPVLGPVQHLHARSPADRAACRPPICSLYVSRDAGASWHKRPLNGEEVYVYGLLAWDSTILLAGGPSFLRSTDFGATWQPVVPQGVANFRRCWGAQLIPGAGSPTVHAWCKVDGKARLLKVGMKKGLAWSGRMGRRSSCARHSLLPPLLWFVCRPAEQRWRGDLGGIVCAPCPRLRRTGVVRLLGRLLPRCR